MVDWDIANFGLSSAQLPLAVLPSRMISCMNAVGEPDQDWNADRNTRNCDPILLRELSSCFFIWISIYVR